MGFDFGFKTEKRQKLDPEIKNSSNELKKVPYNPDKPGLQVPNYAIYKPGSTDDAEPLVLGIKDENEDETDIISGKYEGGKVIWECSIDLIEHLPDLVNPNIKSVLELGCGQGLPAISLAKEFDLENLTLQDYNESVLENETTAVLKHAGFKNEKVEVKLFSGDWNDLKNTKTLLDSRHDCVLISECTYNKEYYDRLHSALESSLDANSDVEIFCAMKEYYFGVGGSVLHWENFVKEKGIFDIEEVCKIEDTLNRFILKMVGKKT